MSQVASMLRGITNETLKQAVRKALGNGWEFGGFTGTTHCYVIWPPTGEKVGFGTTASDRNAGKSFLAQCERISGKKLVEQHKTGKTKTKKMPLSAMHLPVTRLQQDASKRVDQLEEEYRQLALEYRIITMTDVSHREIKRVVTILKRLAKIQEVLDELNQPIPEMGVRDVQIYREMLNADE